MVLLWSTPAAVTAQLGLDGNHQIYQGPLGGAVEAGDHFGASLVAGDFDGDGFDDLAIAATGEEINGQASAGAVFVVYGSIDGLGAGSRPPLVVHQDVTDVLGVAENGDRFGSVLLATDFNRDDIHELVVGIPEEDVDALVDAGAVQVFPGSASGLLATADLMLTRGDFGALDDLEGYRFGASLAAGRLELTVNDALVDLAIGIPGGPLTPTYRGAVMLMDGSGAPGINSFLSFVSSDPGDRVGAAVAVGDINDDGAAGDLIYGGPFAEFGGGTSEEGVVWTRYESDSAGYLPVPLSPAAGSHFGSVLVLGDFLCAGYDQVLVGAPDAEVASMDTAGAAVLYDAKNWTFTYIAQEPDNFFGSPDPMDRFGAVLAKGDFNADGCDDAAFGVPNEDFTASRGAELEDAGIVQILYGSPEGFSYPDNQLWRWGSLLGFTPFSGDEFGGALAAGDFNGDGADDLAIGAPGAEWNLQAETGLVQILYGTNPGSIFFDRFESGGLTAWSSSVP